MYDPVAWVNDVVDFGPEPDAGLAPYQEEILGAVPDRKRVAARGPHGLGKSAMAALALLWFASTREAARIDWKVITTASAWRALSIYLWPEVRKWSRRLRWEVLGRSPYSEITELLMLNLKLVHGAASAVASNKAELIEGAHADSLFYLIDEAKIVPDPTWDAIEGAFSGGRTEGLPEAFALAISTPGPPAGRFYDIHRRAPGLEDWWVRHVTLAEAVAAGRISPEWAEQRARQWGRDSAMYANRVLGEFHASDEDAVIPLAWVEAAIERWHEWNDSGRPPLTGKRFTGVDVARTGADSTVFAHRHGPGILRLETHDREDTMQTTARVQAATGEDEEDQALPVVDSMGVGGGVVDRLRELRSPVVAYTGAAKTRARTRDGEYGFTNCLTGDARVTAVGDLRRIYRSRYEGPLFKVKMASGDEFTATPNHQVLTRSGWVPVESLNVGDELLSAASGEAPDATVRPEVHDMPPMLSEVYRAACRRFGAERVEEGAVNFHGDRPMGEVDVVTVHRELLGLRPSGGEHADQGDLVRPLLRPGALLSDRLTPRAFRGGQRPRRTRAALPHGHVAGRPLTPLLQRHPVLPQIVRLLPAAATDALVAQRALDRALTYAVCVGKGQHAFSGLVAPRDLALVEGLLTATPGDVALATQGHAVISEDAADGVLIDAELLGQGQRRFAVPVPGDEGGLIDAHAPGEEDALLAAPWLDAVIAEHAKDGGPVSPELLCQLAEGRAPHVPLDQVISIERTTSGQGGTYVFTLETATGSYKSQSVVHRNCRSAAYWGMRELLDPAFGAEIMLPPDDLLVSDLTAPTWDVTTGIPPKIRVEKKEDVVARLGRSPDRGDAVAMAFFAERLSASAIHVPTELPAKRSATAARYGRQVFGSSGPR